MKFIAFYIKDGQVEKEVIDSCALSLATVKAKITACRTKKQVKKVIYDDLYLNLKKDFKNNDIKSIYDNIMLYSNDDKLLGENIEEILKNNNIEYAISKQENNMYVNILLNKYLITLNFCYNSYGILEFKDIELSESLEEILERV